MIGRVWLSVVIGFATAFIIQHAAAFPFVGEHPRFQPERSSTKTRWSIHERCFIPKPSEAANRIR